MSCGNYFNNVKISNIDIQCLEIMEMKKINKSNIQNNFDLFTNGRIQYNNKLPVNILNNKAKLSFYVNYYCDSKFKVNISEKDEKVFLVVDEKVSGFYWNKSMSGCECLHKFDLEFRGNVVGRSFYIKEINSLNSSHQISW